jgi:serine/threonine-protein kinase
MRNDTLVTGQVARAGDGGGQVRAAGWSVPGYTAVKALGSGGFGDVVLARHDESGTEVAIKYLRRDLLADERFAQMFRAEAAVLATLDDPHVVRLHEFVESPSGAAIVMELVDGVSLRQILARQGATTPEAALVVLRGSLLGLAAAHARGVVHRDYKPDNVLVDADGASKLTDFGIAARTGERSARGGTLAYAPPEQFAGGPASPAGDVYAATATFFECLTGRPPFGGDTAAALIYQHMSEPVPVDAVPEPLRPLVAAGMAKQPGDRPADAATFAAALSKVAAQAYGPRWHERGRSHLGEAALLLAALWPSGGLPAVQGTTMEKILLRQRHLRARLRHARAVKKTIAAAIAVAVVAGGTVAAIGLTRSSRPVTLPVVTGVSPASGGTAGGTTVTVTGTGLDGATVVRFGGAPGTITADSVTQITVTSPPSASTASGTAGSGTQTTTAGTGIVDVTVTAPGGTSHHTAVDHYTYTASQPAVTGVSPPSGGIAGGTTVTVTGTGLAGATAVRFGAAAAAITADSGTQITVTSPPGTGRVDIIVTTPAGTSPANQGHYYSYSAQPKPAQSIAFSVPAPATAGGAAALSATGGGSGNPVVFSVDPASGPGVCTVSGTTVTYTAIGTCVIDANQAGNGHYADAPQVQHTVTVNGITQSISLTAPALGHVRDSGHLSATGGGSGNPVVLTSASGGVCTVSGTTVTYTAEGSCIVVANQAGDGRYSDAPQVRRTITVKKKPQSISFSAPASGALWSSALLSATGGASGNPVVFTSATPGVCHVSGSTVTYAETGTCVIDANQAGNDVYADAPQVQRTIKVIRVLQYRGVSSSSGGSAG